VRDLYAAALAAPTPPLTAASSASGGDSLSFVELSVALGDVLDRVPPDWHARTIRELATAHPLDAGGGAARADGAAAIDRDPARRRHPPNLFTVYGGAHILLAVAGYNFARFQLGDVPRVARLRSGFAALTQVALPSALWIGLVALFVGTYEPATVMFLNGLLGSDDWTVAVAVLVPRSVGVDDGCGSRRHRRPKIDAAERKAPFVLAAGVLVAGLCCATGWSVSRRVRPSGTHRRSSLVLRHGLGRRQGDPRRRTLARVRSRAGDDPGFFGDLQREAWCSSGLLALLWLREVRAPRLLAMAAGVVASASLAIYLTHWQVYPHSR
jgi:hypothetical protein